MSAEDKGEIIIYQSEDGNVQLDVRLENERVWLTIDQMALLFGKARSTINEHILNADELKVLNNIVSGYFDFAEIQAIRHRPMYMEDYIKQLDGILSGTGEKLLTDAGSVSHRQAIEKAEKEYRKYQVKTLSPVEEAYLDTLKQLEKTAKEKRENE